ncbi:MAG: GldG family protein [Myxococcota bacterium]
MNKTTNSIVLTLAVIGSLVMANMIGWNAFGRLDLTGDQRFTLSPATRTMLDRLEDPVTIRAYFSEQMSPRYSNNRRYVRDILDEYYAVSGGQVVYEFIDPVAEETEEDREKKKDLKRDLFGRIVREKTSVETELEQQGIAAVQDQVVEGDGIQNRKVYMGIVVKHGDDSEVIPVVQDTSTLEYELTTMIRKLTRPTTPKVGVVAGFGGPSEQEGLQVLFQILRSQYDVTALDLSQDPTIPDDVMAVMVIGPTQSLSDVAKQEIDRFVVAGGSAAFFVDDYDVDLRTLQPTKIEHGLKPLLTSYGINVSDGLVLDGECQTISVQGGASLGGIPISQPVKYPLIPSPRQLDPENPITRGLGQSVFPFVNALSLSENEGAETAVLARSSEGAYLTKGALQTDPFALQRLTTDQVENQGVHNFLVSVKGTVKGFYPPADGTEQVGTARLLVAGTSRFIRDELIGRSAVHQNLALNMIDWMLLDEALLEMRTRGLTSAPIEELSDSTRATIRYGNMVGLPLLFVLFGLVRWRMRESKRDSVTF